MKPPTGAGLNAEQRRNAPQRRTPLDGIDLNSELEKRIEIATTCFNHPNYDESFQSFIEQVVEDYLVDAAAVELQLGVNVGI